MQEEISESNFSCHDETTSIIQLLQLPAIHGSKEDWVYQWAKESGQANPFFPLCQAPARCALQRSFPSVCHTSAGKPDGWEALAHQSLPWCWTKLVSQLSHFHLGFNEENVLLLNHFLELVTAISIQCQEGLTGTMKRCFNTCKFLETFTCHMLNLEFELVWQGGCATEAHSPCITKEAVSCLFKDKESTRQY